MYSYAVTTFGGDIAGHGIRHKHLCYLRAKSCTDCHRARTRALHWRIWVTRDQCAANDYKNYSCHFVSFTLFDSMS